VGQRVQIERLCAQQGGAEVVILSDPNTGTQALELRRRLLLRLMAAYPFWTMAKVAVAPRQLPTAWALDTSSTAPRGQGSECICCFAHAGTGVLHLFVGTDPAMGLEEDGVTARTRTALRRLRESGGALLGTYGPARHTLGEAEAISPRLAEALTAIERSFDPKGAMLP
jgi:FAD/FMN-containing dehydrogenase